MTILWQIIIKIAVTVIVNNQYSKYNNNINKTSTLILIYKSNSGLFLPSLNISLYLTSDYL